MFVIVLKKLYNIVRSIFVLDLEIGQIVAIPKMLSLDKFPISFRYYDPILFYLHLNISSDIK